MDAADLLDQRSRVSMLKSSTFFHSIRPLDIDILKASGQEIELATQASSLLNYQCLCIIPTYGFGSEICAQIVESEAFNYQSNG
jgi:hypothetical protein